MSLIQFPNVPLVAGVPDLNQLPLAIGVRTGIVQQLQGLDYFGFLPSDAPQWIIADAQGNALITPDSVVELSYRGEQHVASYPVEEGGFSSYNKVAMPQELTLRLACGGKNMPRDTFLAVLTGLYESLTLVTVVTPDQTYSNYNIDRLDYQRKSSSGLSLLIAEVHLTEIRVSAQASYSSTATASGSDPQNQGWVCTAENTPTPTNQQTPLQLDVNTVKSSFQGAVQSVSSIVTSITTQATQVMSGVGKTLETAVAGLVT